MNQFNNKVVLVTGQTLAVDGGWTRNESWLFSTGV